MDDAGAFLFQSGHVAGSAITFVLSEVVAGIYGVRLLHHPVASHLGDVGRCGYGVADAVSTHHRPERNKAIPDMNKVQQQKGR